MIYTDKLVLSLNRKVKSDTIDKYKDLIDIICGKGYDINTNKYYFQKEAIDRLLSYYLNYKDLGELLDENLSNNSELKEYYRDKYGSNYKSKLEDLDKKLSTIDLPTGTGKSYVIFLVAIILLNEYKEIDRVQIIVPTKTIRKQLTQKFEDFFKRIKSMQNLRIPEMISLHEDALVENSLAIDNIHKFYETDNAILAKEESFGNGKGKNVLVINDEAHHIYNFNESANPRTDEYRDIKKWKEFLFNPDYKITNIINFTATPFEAKDIYFHNVIYRYSLNDAIKNGVVKDIRYLPEGDGDLSEIQAEKQQYKIAISYLNEKKKQFKKDNINIKPIGIIITADIDEAKIVERDFMKILRDTGERNADDKVMCYTSDPKHLKNEPLFENVDIYEGNNSNKIEWIISVSMLSEGWDCKNVFLIVPHQERAFNSRLLISQVVGRGLRRIPDLDVKYQEVIVLNHKKWGDESINLLVNEVVDLTTELPIQPTNYFNFDIKYLEEVYSQYERKIKKQTVKKVSMKKILDDAIKSFTEQTESIFIHRKTKELKEEKEGFLEADLTKDFYSKDYLKSWYIQTIKNDADFEDKCKNEEEFVEYIFNSDVIKKSKVKDKMSLNNFKQIEDAFMSIDWGLESKDIKEFKKYNVLTKNTTDFGISYIRTKTFLEKYDNVFYCADTNPLEKWEYFENLVDTKLKEYKKEERDTFRETVRGLLKNKFIKIEKDKYKTTLNFVLNESNPEKLFLERLFSVLGKDKSIESWIKSKSKGFYYIDCSEGDEIVEFNPDFIIKVDNGKVLLVETKDKGDITKINKIKLKGMVNYLNILNKELKNNDYYGYIISPNDYDEFFTEVIRNKNYRYISKFHKELEKIK